MERSKDFFKATLARLVNVFVAARLMPSLVRLISLATYTWSTLRNTDVGLTRRGMKIADVSNFVGPSGFRLLKEIRSIIDCEVRGIDTGHFVENSLGKTFRKGLKPSSSLKEKVHGLFSATSFRASAALLDEKGWSLLCSDIWIDYPSRSHVPLESQIFHVDGDDRRVIKIFIYLTDVKQPEDGSFVYVPGSHNEIVIGMFFLWLDYFYLKNGGCMQNGRLSDGVVRRFFGNEGISICGRAGTVIYADTTGIHKGYVPSSIRSIAVATFTAS